MAKKKAFRCTFEWDVETGRDGRNDAIIKRHICTRPMHHEGKHKSKSGKTAVTPTTYGVK